MDMFRDVSEFSFELRHFSEGDCFRVIPEKGGKVADGFGIFGGVHVHISGDIDYGSVYRVEVLEITSNFLYTKVLEKVEEGPHRQRVKKLKKADTSDVVASKNEILRGLR